MYAGKEPLETKNLEDETTVSLKPSITSLSDQH